MSTVDKLDATIKVLRTGAWRLTPRLLHLLRAVL